MSLARVAALLPALLSVAALAQGTQADYARPSSKSALRQADGTFQPDPRLS